MSASDWLRVYFSLMRIALGLEYDGSRFCGWQSQPSGQSVQDVLEKALSHIAGNRVRVIASGRTDAGVHAFHQVVHFDTDTERPVNAWVRGSNAILPDTCAILWALPVSDEFHARHSVLERCYYYLLLNRPVRSALYQGRAGWFHHLLDLERMQAAASLLIGRHDFTSFRASECQAVSPVRELTRLDITRQNDLILFELRANGFLQHMVRNIIGCLVYIGKGKYSPEWIHELLAIPDRTRAAPTFAADGLYLAGAVYDAGWNLPPLPERLAERLMLGSSMMLSYQKPGNN